MDPIPSRRWDIVSSPSPARSAGAPAAVLPAATVTMAVALETPPESSVTERRAVYVPAAAYVWLAFWVLGVPSAALWGVVTVVSMQSPLSAQTFVGTWVRQDTPMTLTVEMCCKTGRRLTYRIAMKGTEMTMVLESALDGTDAPLLVAGKPTHSRWRDRVRGSLLDALIRGSGDLEIHVIAPGDEPARRALHPGEGARAGGEGELA